MNRFDPMSRKYIFLSFETGVKEYIFISKDVIFHEENFIQLDNESGLFEGLPSLHFQFHTN